MPSFISDKRDSQIIMGNNHNLEYTGTILIGGDMQPLEVVWDTGSSWLIVEGSDCANCASPVYVYQNNPDTYTSLGGAYTMAYADGTSTTSAQVLDHVCLADSTGAPEGFYFEELGSCAAEF
jgi:hypothetical protein